MHIFYKTNPRIFSRLLPLMLTLFALPAAAQIKFGGPPVLRNDAILELGSGKKGLLLPRVNNAAIASHPLDTAAAGMLVFNTNDQSLYIKKFDALTPWTRINDGNNLSLNSLTDVNIGAPAANQLIRFQAGKWSNWTPDFISTSQLLTFTGGDVEGTTALTGNIVLNLKNSVAAGSFPKLTYNAKGLITGGGPLLAADITGGSNNYIQNQTAAAQTSAGFRIDGAGTVKSMTVTDMTVDGGVVFTNATGTVAQKAAQLVWDNASNELGVGTATPGAKLDVNGDFKLGTNGTPLVGIQKTSVSVTDITPFSWSDAPRQVVATLPTGIVLKSNDNIIVNPRTNLTARVGIAWSRVTNAGARQITVCFNNTGNDATVGTVVLDVTIIQN
ncbi:hypothetical protein EGT74_02670 [Chitinophaga lutea]|uniref:Uncharacterized protein n=1 Tax=Chitinophaga lutea TaxID=2488634 RepID=A0A3N4QLC9_9BACT|nr:hypothetical protein [Chitinophaga lutea]RPE12474.1 hypothetical protein EGT74_02670 [Chitinophaga lutea]